MNKKVTIIDYGVSNLLNVVRAFEHCGAEVSLAETPEQVKQAERLVLPGVGAFADGMAGLRERGLVEAVRDYARSERPFLGICLGMQMMFEGSEEFGANEGLGLVAGQVVAIPETGVDGTPHKIPHVGWSELQLPPGRTSYANSVLSHLSEETSVYFVHSFMAVPANPAHRLADYDYDGRSICAAVQAGNLFGCQFHPEKSGKSGLEIVRSFISLN